MTTKQLAEISNFLFNPILEKNRLDIFSYYLLVRLRPGPLTRDELCASGLTPFYVDRCLKRLLSSQLVTYQYDESAQRGYALTSEANRVLDSLLVQNELFKNQVTKWLIEYVEMTFQRKMTSDQAHEVVQSISEYIEHATESEIDAIVGVLARREISPHKEPSAPEKLEKWDPSGVAREIIDAVNAGRISDPVVVNLVTEKLSYHFFTKVILNPEMFENLRNLEKPVVLLDTNVIVAAVTDADIWNGVTRTLMSTIARVRETGHPIRLIVTDQTLRELTFLFDYIFSEIDSIEFRYSVHGGDETKLKTFREWLDYSPIAFYFSREWQSLKAYRSFVERSLRRFFKQSEIEILSVDRLGVSRETVDEQTSLMEDVLEKSRKIRSDKTASAVRHKVWLVLASDALSERDQHAWIWTYNKVMQDFETRVLGYRAHSLYGYYMAAFLEPYDMASTFEEDSERYMNIHTYMKELLQGVCANDAKGAELRKILPWIWKGYHEKQSLIQSNPHDLRTRLGRIYGATVPSQLESGEPFNGDRASMDLILQRYPIFL